MTRFALAAQAEVDLVDIASYITQDSPKAASRFIERLERIFTMLAASPPNSVASGKNSPRTFVASRLTNI